MSDVVRNAVCQGCGCLCDDVEVAVSGETINRVDRACDLGRNWFEAQQTKQTSVGDDFLHQAAKLLVAARFPIVLGIESLTTEAQRIAIRLAELLGGVIAGDPIPAMIARQEVGETTCTLGEIKARADLVVFWFADPMRTHPRHLERYSGCDGRFLPNGRKDRTIIVVGDPSNATRAHADDFIEVSAEEEFDTLIQLRQCIKGSIEEPPVEPSTCWTLARRMMQAKYGALVFDPASGGSTSSRNEIIFKLVRDLNLKTCFVASPLGLGGNAKGAEAVMQWKTGFPGNVAFPGGAARYNGDEFAADNLLKRGRVDAALIVGEWSVDGLSSKAADRFKSVPIVRLRTTSLIESTGTVFRMDGVPLRSDSILHGDRLQGEAALQRLVDEVERIRTAIA